jgi:hypothetical protein
MEMVKGYMYRIRTRTGQQKYPREHQMTYMGEDIHGDLQFNARPFAGTQAIRKADIVSIAAIRPTWRIVACTP